MVLEDGQAKLPGAERCPGASVRRGYGLTMPSAKTWRSSNATVTGCPAKVAAPEMLNTASVSGTSSVGPVPLMIGTQLRRDP
jgi:hypothetical protein